MENESRMIEQREENVLNQYRTKLEKLMLELPEETKAVHNQYMAGYIDSLYDFGHLSENNREILYGEYAF